MEHPNASPHLASITQVAPPLLNKFAHFKVKGKLREGVKSFKRGLEKIHKSKRDRIGPRKSLGMPLPAEMFEVVERRLPVGEGTNEFGGESASSQVTIKLPATPSPAPLPVQTALRRKVFLPPSPKSFHPPSPHSAKKLIHRKRPITRARYEVPRAVRTCSVSRKAARMQQDLEQTSDWKETPIVSPALSDPETTGENKQWRRSPPPPPPRRSPPRMPLSTLYERSTVVRDYETIPTTSPLRISRRHALVDGSPSLRGRSALSPLSNVISQEERFSHSAPTRRYHEDFALPENRDEEDEEDGDETLTPSRFAWQSDRFSDDIEELEQTFGKMMNPREEEEDKGEDEVGDW